MRHDCAATSHSWCHRSIIRAPMILRGMKITANYISKSHHSSGEVSSQVHQDHDISAGQGFSPLRVKQLGFSGGSKASVRLRPRPPQVVRNMSITCFMWLERRATLRAVNRYAWRVAWLKWLSCCFLGGCAPGVEEVRLLTGSGQMHSPQLKGDGRGKQMAFVRRCGFCSCRTQWAPQG